MSVPARMLVSAPVLVPVRAPDEVVSVGVAPPPEDGELDADEAGVEGVVLAGVDAVPVTLGSADWDGLGVLAGQGELDAVAAAVLVLVALVLVVVAAFVVVLLTAPALWVPVAVAVAVALVLPPASALRLDAPLAGLLVLPLAGLLTELAGTAFGVDFADSAAADAESVGHALDVPLLWPTALAPWLVPPTAVSAGLADPATPWAPSLALELAIPTTAEPSWTTAPRSGGTARATPMANTAQAAARAGRSSPYRQSRCCRG